MLRLRRNKNELLVLTGSIYFFVAYLTAFSLEILFLVDLSRQSQTNEQQLVTNLGSQDQDVSNNNHQSITNGRVSLDNMNAHITISCLAISILYFVLFISSLILIVALILRSTFMLLIWMCAMTTMYLPEFGLVLYVSAYSWGIDTRNGQTEMIFYLFRAILNVIFITRAHKLFKQWKYEKDFFRMKSGLGGLSGFSTISRLGSTSTNGPTSSSGRGCFGAYDSPFFVGDSLTTTINPVFSSSTLDMNRYDHVRELGPRSSPANNSMNTSVFSSSDYVSDYNNATSSASNQQRHQQPIVNGHSRQHPASSIYRIGTTRNASPSGARYHHPDDSEGGAGRNNKYRRFSSQPTTGAGFFLGETELTTKFGTKYQGHNSRKEDPLDATGRAAFNYRNQSLLSINDYFPDYEMDLDYRTLEHHRNNKSPEMTADAQRQMTSSRSQDHLAYSTQSLDRRHAKEHGFSTEQVILRPLGHQPFEYLHRPGSTSNLNKLESHKPSGNRFGYH